MKQAFLVMLVLSSSCASLQTASIQASPIQAAHQFSANSIFHVRERYVESMPDGKSRIHTSFGNAVLVGHNLLATCAHVVTTDPNRPSTVHVLGPRGPVLARVAVTDLSRDIAILEADVPGVPLQIQDLKNSDNLLYLVGVLTEGFAGTIISNRFFHQVRRLRVNDQGYIENGEDPRKEYEPYTVVLDTFIPGMSGSPLLTPDGFVAGLLSAKATDYPIGLVVPARYLLKNLDYYHKNVAPKKK